MKYWPSQVLFVEPYGSALLDDAAPVLKCLKTGTRHRVLTGPSSFFHKARDEFCPCQCRLLFCLL